MRTAEQIMADAADGPAFSNGSEYSYWANSGKGCYDCVHDNPATETYCPILSVGLLGRWPKEWAHSAVGWTSTDGSRSGSYEVVGQCTEFERRRKGGGDGPKPKPAPPDCDGQVDMFEVFADQIVEHVESVVHV
jgi:hypothetical protein